MTITDLTAIVGAVAAVIALALSIYNFFIDRTDKTAKVGVMLSKGMAENLFADPYGNAWHTTHPVFHVEVINDGHVPVVLSGWGIECKTKSTFKEIVAAKNGELKPNVLEPGHNTNFEADYNETLKELAIDEKDKNATVRAVVRLAVGKKFHSQMLKLT